MTPRRGESSTLVGVTTRLSGDLRWLKFTNCADEDEDEGKCEEEVVVEDDELAPVELEEYVPIPVLSELVVAVWSPSLTSFEPWLDVEVKSSMLEEGSDTL